MALVTNLEKVSTDKARIHGPVECTYTVFSTGNGQKVIQLNTFGSAGRANPGRQSQTIQLSESAVRQLMEICTREFS